MTVSYKHNHEQSVAAIEWNINHNLDTTAPVCDCHVDIDGTMHKILPLSVQVIDSMNIKVTWSTARAGTCAVR